MTFAEHCETLAKRWLESSEEQLSEFTYSDIEAFLPVQIEQFLAEFLNFVSNSSAKDYFYVACYKVTAAYMDHFSAVYLSQNLSRLVLKNYWCDFIQTLQE